MNISQIILTGNDASKPVTGYFPGRLYFATDTGKVYRDTGSAWTDMGISGGGGGGGPDWLSPNADSLNAAYFGTADKTQGNLMFSYDPQGPLGGGSNTYIGTYGTWGYSGWANFCAGPSMYAPDNQHTVLFGDSITAAYVSHLIGLGSYINSTNGESVLLGGSCSSSGYGYGAIGIGYGSATANESIAIGHYSYANYGQIDIITGGSYGANAIANICVDEQGAFRCTAPQNDDALTNYGYRTAGTGFSYTSLPLGQWSVRFNAAGTAMVFTANIAGTIKTATIALS